jgi:hypothetical protein
LVNAKVTVLDSTGKTSSSVNVNADGSYSMSTVGLTPPLLIQATGYSGTQLVTLYSIANTGSQVANVTPLTQAIALLSTQTSPDQIFNGNASLPSASSLTSSISASNTTLQNVLNGLITFVNGATDSSLDFIQTPFSANHTGMDRVLDYVSVQPSYQTVGSTQIPTVNIFGTTGNSMVTLVPNQSNNATLGSSSTFPTINFASIPSLLNGISGLVASGDYSSSDWTQYIDSSFLDQGRNLTSFLSHISSMSSGSSVSNSYSTNYCYTNSSSDQICSINGTILSSANAVVNTFEMPVILRNGSANWKLYGNQSQVGYDVQTFIQKFIRLDNVSLTDAQTYASGIHFDIEQSSNTIQSATFSVVSNGTQLQNPVFKLKQQSGCEYMGLVDANNNPTCNNEYVIDGNNSGTVIDGSSTLSSILSTYQGGGTFFRLTLYSDSNFTTVVQTIDNIPLQGGLPIPALSGKQMTFPTLVSSSITTLTNYTSSVGTTFNLTVNPNVTINGMDVTVNNGATTVDDNSGSNDVQLSPYSYQINLSSVLSGVTTSSYRSVYISTGSAMFVSTKYFGCGGQTCY